MGTTFDNPGYNPDLEGLSRYVEEIDRIIRENDRELIPVLQQIQNLLGFLPRNVLLRVADKIDVPITRIYGVATYYNRFRLTPVGKYLMRVCCGTTCHIAGADQLKQSISNELGIEEGQTTTDELFTLDVVPCVGCCSLGPVILVNGEAHGRLTPTDTLQLIKRCRDDVKEEAPDPSGTVARSVGTLEGPDANISIRVGMGACGISAGARHVYRAIEEEIAKRKHLAPVSLAITGCEGACYEEVLVYVQKPTLPDVVYKRVTPDKVKTIFDEHVEGSQIITEWVFDDSSRASSPARRFYDKQSRVILRRCGRIDPEAIDDYLRDGGYDALERAIVRMSRDAVIREIEMSGLRGRGGAGFPTGTKWRKVSDAAGLVKYVICNADEGDPGAFMDRNVIESDPHSVIEGMLIAAYAVQSARGFIYVREEYPLAVQRLRIALAQAKARKFLGEDILGSGFSFDIEIKEGAGAFVCGEETALIRSIEGHRGVPTPRPPYPTESGLWGKPTLINNVETLANVAHIIREGVDAYAACGTAQSKGTKIFTLAGSIEHGGMIEVPMGTTIREIVYDIGGGNRGQRIKAVHIGGPSGGCLPERLFDTRIDFDQLQRWGTIMGSGGMLVMDGSTCMVDIAKYFLQFTQAESCGKCTFCRIGTKRMFEILDRITKGRGEAGDLSELEELALQVKESSACGLGKSASNPVLTTIRYFREEYDAHIVDKRCPAMKCRDLLAYDIDRLMCEGCTVCSHYCQANAISRLLDDISLVISPEKCTHCGACHDVCHFDAVLVSPLGTDESRTHHN